MRVLVSESEVWILSFKVPDLFPVPQYHAKPVPVSASALQGNTHQSICNCRARKGGLNLGKIALLIPSLTFPYFLSPMLSPYS